MTQDRLNTNFRKVQTEAKYITLHTLIDHHLQKDSVDDEFTAKKNNSRFLIKTIKEIFVINFENVLCCIAENNYTTVHLDDGTKVTVSKTLKDFVSILYPSHFFRIHSGSIINLKFIRRITKAPVFTVELPNKFILKVSRSKQKELLDKLMTI